MISPDYELYSMKEQVTYTEANTTLVLIDGIYLVTSPDGEPLVLRRR